MGAKLMGRKNIFDSSAPEPMHEQQKSAALPEAFQYGPVGAMRNNLREIGARSIQDLDPELIEDTGHRDRMDITDEDVADLRASIAAYGQQVPILVRPHPRLSGRYQVVYGRRRLAVPSDHRADAAVLRIIDELGEMGLRVDKSRVLH